MSDVVLLFLLRCFAQRCPPFLFGGRHPSGVAMFQHTGGELNESGDVRNSIPRALGAVFHLIKEANTGCMYCLVVELHLKKMFVPRGENKKLLKPPPRLILCIVTNLVESFCCKNLLKMSPCVTLLMLELLLQHLV